MTSKSISVGGGSGERAVSRVRSIQQGVVALAAKDKDTQTDEGSLNVGLSKGKDEGIAERLENDQKVADAMHEKERLWSKVLGLVTTALLADEHVIKDGWHPTHGAGQDDQKGDLCCSVWRGT